MTGCVDDLGLEPDVNQLRLQPLGRTAGVGVVVRPGAYRGDPQELEDLVCKALQFFSDVLLNVTHARCS